MSNIISKIRLNMTTFKMISNMTTIVIKKKWKLMFFILLYILSDFNKFIKINKNVV